jgi:2-polyprenyl-6-methoxyphenol hydroxylase-like FAD-dependent oxidoreductase
MVDVDIHPWPRFAPGVDTRPRARLRVAVVGAGPGGLLAAWKLLDLGHDVVVLESRPPHAASKEDDVRSFNLTADGLGLSAFGKLRPLIYAAGTIVDGRAIHRPPRPVFTHRYGCRASDHLVSVARRDVLVLLAATIENHPRCRLLFDHAATDARPAGGRVLWNGPGDGGDRAVFEEAFDLVVFADGMRGLGQRLAREIPSVGSTVTPHEVAYLKVTIRAEAVARLALPLDKINFFPGRSSLAIGLPNQDGSISALIEDRFEGASTRPIFSEPWEAATYCRRLNERLVEAVPDLADQIIGQRPGFFYTTRIDSWRLGPRAILLGDAGACAPPWAGFGMNLACSHASDLARVLTRFDDLDTALEAYNRRRVATSHVIQDVVAAHGSILTSEIGSARWRMAQSVRDWRERVLGRRTPYQTIAFEEHGLARLAGLGP